MLLFLVVAALLLLVLLLLLLLFLLLQLLYCTRHRHLLSSLLYLLQQQQQQMLLVYALDRQTSPLPLTQLGCGKSFWPKIVSPIAFWLALLFFCLFSTTASLPLLFYTIYILFIHIYIFVRVCGACVPVFVYCLRIYYFECDVI